MSKKQNTPQRSSKAVEDKLNAQVAKFETINTFDETIKPSNWLSILTEKYIPYIIIGILGIVLYANTFKHEYALDDEIIISKNEYVLQGVNGFGKIFTSDVFESFYKSMNTTAQLSGGRYRPFSVATFAIEQEFIGTMKPSDTVASFLARSWDLNKNGKGDVGEDLDGNGLYNDRDAKVNGMPMRHIVSSLLYILSACIIFYFLSTYFFKENKLIALIATLLFLAHPIHTEVVANVKSRDEILSLMFMVLTMIFSLKYGETKNNKFLLFAGLSYFIALLSKEYGATLLILVPLLVYLLDKKNFSIGKYAPLFGILLASFAVYYYIRSGIVIGTSELQDDELMNNPYLLCEGNEKLATVIYTNLKYFGLLILPLKLSCDYSYGVIPYVELSHWGVWVTIGIFIIFIYWGFKSLMKKSWIAFAIAFILLHLFLVNNFFFNIGATMGERLVYHSSLGVCMLMAYGMYMLSQKLNNKAIMLTAALPFLVFYTFKTIQRNPAWKNDITLHLTDVKTYPNSTMLLANACTRNIELSEIPKNKPKEKEYLKEAIYYGQRSLQNHPKFVNSLLNVGIIKAKLGEMDSAKYFWDKVREYYPHHPQLAAIDLNLGMAFYNKGSEFVAKKDFANACIEMQKAYPYMKQNANLLHDLAVTYFYTGQYSKAKQIWIECLAINPGNTQAKQGVAQLNAQGY